MRFAPCGLRTASLVTVFGAALATASWAEPELAAGLSVTEVLQIVAKAPQHDAKVRLLLKSGAAVSGVVSSVSSDNKTLVLKQEDNSTVVLDATRVDSVSIVDPGSAKGALLGGKMYRSSSDEVPSGISIRRRMQILANGTPIKIIAQLTKEQEASADCRFYTDRVLTATESAIADIVEDDLGKKALTAKGNTVRVNSAPGLALEVRVAATSPEVLFDCSSALPSDFAAQIKRGLESVL